MGSVLGGPDVKPTFFFPYEEAEVQRSEVVLSMITKATGGRLGPGTQDCGHLAQGPFIFLTQTHWKAFLKFLGIIFTTGGKR